MNKIFIFNAGHEGEIQSDTPSYTSPARITKITKDFAGLPVWYADESDYVLVNDAYTAEYYMQLKELGLKLPAVILAKELKNVQEGVFVPWGISRQILLKIKNLCLSNEKLKIPEWNDELSYLNNRQFAIDILSELKNEGLLPEIISIPQIFYSLADFSTYVEKFNTNLLVKAPYSSSGIGLLWIRDGIAQSEQQILKGFFKRQGNIVVERVYNKVLDLAFEYIIDQNRSITFQGISLFQTNWKGAYTGNFLKSQTEINRLLSNYISLDYIELIKEELGKLLLKHCSSTPLTCVGVDMMVIEEAGQFYLHPCVEINPRFNMGYLAVEMFNRHVSEHSEGKYFVQFGSSASLQELHKNNNEQYPLVIKDGKIHSGYLSLTPISDDTGYCAGVILSS